MSDFIGPSKAAEMTRSLPSDCVGQGRQLGVRRKGRRRGGAEGRILPTRRRSGPGPHCHQARAVGQGEGLALTRGGDQQAGRLADLQCQVARDRGKCVAGFGGSGPCAGYRLSRLVQPLLETVGGPDVGLDHAARGVLDDESSGVGCLLCTAAELTAGGPQPSQLADAPGARERP